MNIEPSAPSVNIPSRRDPGIPTTNVTNEIVDAMAQMAGGGGLSGDPQRRGAPKRVRCFITGEESSPDAYTCEAWIHAPDYRDPTKPLTSAILKSERVVASAVFRNILELGDSPGHALTDPANTTAKFFWGELVDFTADDRPIYEGLALWAQSCTTSRPGEITAPVSITEDATLDGTMSNVYVDTTAGDVTLNLPAIASIGAYSYTVFVSGGNNAIIDPDGSETIHGLSTETIASGDFLTITSPGIGTNWY